MGWFVVGKKRWESKLESYNKNTEKRQENLSDNKN